jgi:hypothetical protein
MKKVNLLLLLSVLTFFIHSCSKTIDGTLQADLSNNAVVGPGTGPNPTFNPIKFRALAQLSLERGDVVAVAAGGKIIFAGGVIDTGWGILGFVPQTRVDIFDTATLTRTTAELSLPRWGVGAAAVGNKVFFAGGYSAYEVGSDRVDIYDVVANTWSIATLSQARAEIAVTALGDKVVFAGGRGENVPEYTSSVIDIFNMSNKSWTTGSFVSNFMPAAASGGNIMAVAGVNNSGYSSARLYNTTSNSWSTHNLYFNLNPASIEATATAGKIIFAGSNYGSSQPPIIQVLNTANMQWAQQTLTGARILSASCASGNYAFFLNKSNTSPFPPLNKIDIYNAQLNKWYQQTLQQPGYVCAASGKTLMIRSAGTTVQVYTIN